MLSYISICAVFYIIGVYVCDFFTPDYIMEIISITILTACVLLLVFRRWRKYIFAAVIFAVIGIICCSYAENFERNPLYLLEDKYIEVDGYVTDIPNQSGDNYTYKLKAKRAYYLDKEYKPNQIVVFSSPQKIELGNNVKIHGFLERFSDKKNSTDFNVRRYYQSHGIFYKMYARETEDTHLKTKDFSFVLFVNMLRNNLLKFIDKNFEGDSAAILKAVTVGNKRDISDELKDVLTYTGIIKFLYPSYLHIYIISIVVGFLFSFLKKSWRDWILVFFLIIYAALNSFSVVFFKNALAVIVGIIMMKKIGFSHKTDIISIAILISCILNPLYCFNAGMVISIASGLLVYYMTDVLLGVLFFVPSMKIRRWLCFYIITTFGMLPITAYYFNGISLYGTLFSPLYILEVSFLIILVPLMCIFSLLFNRVFIIKFLINQILSYFTVLPYYIKKLPFSYIPIKRPSFIFIIIFFMGIYLIYQFYLRGIKKRYNIAVSCALAGLFISMITAWVMSIGNMTVTFVNVGQGDGMIVNVKGGETILIDGGGKVEFSDYDAGEEVYLPYLIDNGYFKIDKAFVSHYHTDHCLGIIAAAKSLKVKEMVLPNYDKDDKYRRELETIAKRKNIKITYAEKGDVINFDSGMTINILSPSQNELMAGDANNSSLVICLEYNKFKCLFDGDITAEVEKNILSDLPDCDVVKMSHHGSEKSNCIEFAKAVKTEYAIASVGENNMFYFPSKDAVYNYQQTGSKVLRTDVNGDIIISVDKKGDYEIYRKKNQKE